jgi:cob(I)alamin adenosyltransferase
MALNKKQKKQLDVIRKKIPTLRQQLAGEKEQMDDPANVKRLEDEIAKLEEQVRAIRADS